ncbi:MAG: RidA family protein [Burkholderiaceae bacterium]|nr:MAG: RidA family protein [Burkholderiaceae bacterium]TAM02564.1 MAG: RidA family protein [Pusillimonas sp.]
MNPPGLHPTPGFHHVVIAEPGPAVFVAGQVALGTDFSVIGGSDLAAQTKAAMRNLGTALKSVGADFSDVVRRTIYTLHPTEYEVITAAVEEIQGNKQHPAETIVGVTQLAIPGLLIEIEATARLCRTGVLPGS